MWLPRVNARAPRAAAARTAAASVWRRTCVKSRRSSSRMRATIAGGSGSPPLPWSTSAGSTSRMSLPSRAEASAARSRLTNEGPPLLAMEPQAWSEAITCATSLAPDGSRRVADASPARVAHRRASTAAKVCRPGTRGMSSSLARVLGHSPSISVLTRVTRPGSAWRRPPRVVMRAASSWNCSSAWSLLRRPKLSVAAPATRFQIASDSSGDRP